MTDEKKSPGSPGTTLAPTNGNGQSGPTDLVVPPGSTINFNQLIVQITERAEPSDWEHQAKALISLTQAAARAEIEIYSERQKAQREAKTLDPDLIEKRRNNALRRHLKWVIVAMAAVCIGLGTLLTCLSLSEIVSTMLLGLGGALAVALVVLSSGESVSTDDMVRVLNAIWRRDTPQPPGGTIDSRPQSAHDPRKKGGRR